MGSRQYLSSYLLVGISSLASILRPLVLIPIVTRTLGKEAYGIWAQTVVTALFLAPVLTLRLMTALTRYLAGSTDGRDLSRCYLYGTVLVVVTSALTLGITWLVCPGIAWFVFGDSSLVRYVWPGMAYACACSLATMVNSYYYTVGRQASYSLLNVLLSVGDCLLMFWFAPAGQIETCIYALAGWQVAVSVGTLGIIVRRHGWAWPAVSGFPGLWKYALWMLLSHWVFFAAGQGNRYVVVGLLGLELTAVYVIAVQVSHVLSLVSMPNQFVLMPMISAHWNTGRLELARPVIRMAYLVFALLGFPVMAAIQQLGEPLVALLSGKGYVASPVLLLLLTGAVLVMGFVDIFSMAFRMSRELARYQVIGLIAGFLNLGLPFLLIPTLGLVGVGISFFLAAGVMAVLTYRTSIRIFGIGMDWGRTAKAAGLGVLVYLALMPLSWLALGSLSKLILGAAITVAVSIAGFFVLRVSSLADIARILGTRATRSQRPKDEVYGVGLRLCRAGDDRDLPED